MFKEIKQLNKSKAKRTQQQYMKTNPTTTQTHTYTTRTYKLQHHQDIEPVQYYANALTGCMHLFDTKMRSTFYNGTSHDPHDPHSSRQSRAGYTVTLLAKRSRYTTSPSKPIHIDVR